MRLVEPWAVAGSGTHQIARLILLEHMCNPTRAARNGEKPRRRARRQLKSQRQAHQPRINVGPTGAGALHGIDESKERPHRVTLGIEFTGHLNQHGPAWIAVRVEGVPKAINGLASSLSRKDNAFGVLGFANLGQQSFDTVRGATMARP